MKTLSKLIMITTLIIPMWGAPQFAVASPTPELGTSAEATAVIDVASGRLIYSKEGDKQMRIASLTKVMTAIVAIEYGNIADQVTIGAQAAGKEGSSIYLRANQQMSLLHLLYGLMLRSGNDAAVAIAEHVGGSNEGFAYLMNDKAALIGMDNTHFMNPSGLDQEGHYSTANDMAKLTAYALRNPVFQEIVKTKVKRVPNPDEGWDYVWANKNKMLSIYTGGDGVKTGYTKQAGRCLISSATRGGQQFAVVTLNDGDDWTDHGRALDYAFRYFPANELVRAGEAISGTNLAVAGGFSYPLSEDERAQIVTQVVMHPVRSTEYLLGERGKLAIRLGDQTIAELPLYDLDHVRIKVADQSVFGFRASEQGKMGMAVQWIYYLDRIVHSLFTVGDR